MPKLYVHNWKAAYLKRTMDRYGMTPELLVAFSGAPLESILHMLAGHAPVTTQVAAIVRLYSATPKARRIKIAKQLVAALPPQSMEWRTVIDFPEYEVSARGEVRRHGRILRPVLSRSGHHGVTLYNGIAHGAARGRKLQVHKIVARAFLGNSPFPGAIVRHLNGHPHDNHPENLCWGTAKENVADRSHHYRNGKPRPPVDTAWNERLIKRKFRRNFQYSNELPK